MSKSRKKSPVYSWTTAKSESWDKKAWHGRFRNANRLSLKRLLRSDMEDTVFPHIRDVSNPYSFAKDGHVWASSRHIRDMGRLSCLNGDEKAIARYIKRLFGK